MRKKLILATLTAGLAGAGLLNTGCSGDLGPAMRDAAISASATFVETTVLEILNSWYDMRGQE